jgi:NTP pyrophosphatase (non-canonical NTP hydrolase)
MDLKEYTALAVRTESRPEEVKVNHQFLVNVLYVFCASGRMLDQIKKHAFYGKAYAIENFTMDYQMIERSMYDLQNVRINGTSEEMGEEPVDTIDLRIFHAIIGIATESTELCEALYSTLTGGTVDLVNLREENGDINWYQAIFYDAMTELGFTGHWDDDLETNIAKLKKRFPNKFTNEDAINRDTDAEREILEDGHK